MTYKHCRSWYTCTCTYQRGLPGAVGHQSIAKPSVWWPENVNTGKISFCVLAYAACAYKSQCVIRSWISKTECSQGDMYFNINNTFTKGMIPTFLSLFTAARGLLKSQTCTLPVSAQVAANRFSLIRTACNQTKTHDTTLAKTRSTRMQNLQSVLNHIERYDMTSITHIYSSFNYSYTINSSIVTYHSSI